MNQNETMILAAMMLASIFLLMPTLFYMFDKINQHSERKRSLLGLWLFWPFAPFMYYRVWKGHRNDCKAFPMILWIIVITVVFGGGTILEVFDIIRSK